MIEVYHVFTDGKDLWTQNYRFARKLYDHWKKWYGTARFYVQRYENEEALVNDEMFEEELLFGYSYFPW
jgi:hypothetical protein